MFEMTKKQIDEKIQGYVDGMKTGKINEEFGKMMIGFLKEKKPSLPNLKQTAKQRKELGRLFSR